MHFFCHVVLTFFKVSSPVDRANGVSGGHQAYWLAGAGIFLEARGMAVGGPFLAGAFDGADAEAKSLTSPSVGLIARRGRSRGYRSGIPVELRQLRDCVRAIPV